MKLIGDYERIADHAVNILESAEEVIDMLKEDLRTRHFIWLQNSNEGSVKPALALSFGNCIICISAVESQEAGAEFRRVAQKAGRKEINDHEEKSWSGSGCLSDACTDGCSLR